MALRWIDSFDHYVTADIPAKYDSISGSPAITATSRFGSGALQLTDANTQHTVVKVFDAQPTWIVGFAFRYVMSGGNKQIFTLIDNATIQVTLYYETSTRKLFLNGPFGSSLSTLGLSDNTWYYIETKVTIGNAGSWEVRVDGNTWITGSGDTQASANASADRFRFEAGGSGGTSTARIFDDVYILDGTGAAPLNDFLGDVRVEALFPNANGNSSQLVGSDADSVNNYLLVDDPTPDGDTSYVESSTVGNKDTYAFTNLTPTLGTVYGVQISSEARKTDAGLRTVKNIARLSTTEVDGAANSLSSSYRMFNDIMTTKPGGGAWTITDVNNAEFGIKVFS